ncbi:Hcp family type VI secretion system effector [Marinibacterium sp. SX1]|uniref:Hcp family type VI secretion system effector n=1 Tax=Marinibacterium sp. SX1 TaxID=3388424 RepID=UPI003D1669BB
MHIGDIEGEGTEKNHIKWIPLKSVDWGLERTLDMDDLSTTQRGYANAKFNKISVTTELSCASAKIMTSVANGTVRDDIKIHLCRSGDDPSKGMEPYLIFTLKHAVIDTYSVNGGEEQVPEESWAVAYRHIEIEYKMADPKTGALKPKNKFAWDLLQGIAG